MTSRISGLSTFGALLAFAFSAGAVAHGGLSMDEDICRLKIGPYSMHFSGFQPEKTTTQEFCEDIPATGQTIVVLDYINDELRDMPTEVRIIKDTGNESDLDAITLLHLPPSVHPTGSLHFEYNFEQQGKYVGLVTVGDKGQQHVSRFPFSVGMSNPLYGQIFFALIIVAVGIGFYLYSGRKKKPAPSSTQTPA